MSGKKTNNGGTYDFKRNKLLRANRSTKTASKDLQVFDSPDYPALAEVRIDICYNESAMALPSRPKTFHFTELKTVPIGVLKIFPGFQFELFEGMINSNFNTSFYFSVPRTADNNSHNEFCRSCLLPWHF